MGQIDRERFGKFGGGKRGGPLGVLRGVDLTDAQRDQIRTIMQSNKPDQATIQELRTLVKAAREGNSTADQQARIKAIRQQQQAKQKAVHDQVLNVLTAEQKAQIEQRKTQMKQRMEQFKQKREQFRQNRQKRFNPGAPKTDKTITTTKTKVI